MDFKETSVDFFVTILAVMAGIIVLKMLAAAAAKQFPNTATKAISNTFNMV